MQLTTVQSNQVWQSPDGNRKIWEVTLADEQGEQYYKLKTFSPAISQKGFSGELKTYLNARGERFVRQDITKTPETEKAGASGRSRGYQRDDNAIRAQWAIGQAINLAAVKMDKEAITLPVIEKYARELFATVSRVKGEELTAEQEADAERYIKTFTQPAAA